MTDITESKTNIGKLINYAANQGPTTLLLFLICIGIYFKVDPAIDKIQKGYDDNASQLNSTVERILTQQEKDIQRLLDVIRQHHNNHDNHSL